MAPSLSPIQPEQVAHGSEITVNCYIPGVTTPTRLAEVYELNWDEDQSIVAVPVVGSRITGYRQGRIKVTGSFKVYWVNQMARAMLSGVNPPTAAGASVVTLYHSARPFYRFDIQVISSLASSPSLIIKNAIFEKDAVKWAEAALSDETINFTAEDVQGS